MNLTEKRYHLYMLRVLYEARCESIYRELRKIEEDDLFPFADDPEVFAALMVSLEKE